MGIHKYGPDASSSQLDIKSLGTRIPRTVGHELYHCMGRIICCVLTYSMFVYYKLCEISA